MKLFQNHRHLLFFIGSSLLLLATVEFLWLRKLYKEEREHIQTDIEMRLKENTTKLQIAYMQNNSRYLVDSFMAKQEKENEKDINRFKKWRNRATLPLMMQNLQNTYFAKLDTLSNLSIGNKQDNATIDSFLNEMRKDYRRRNSNINVKPNWDKDSMEVVNKIYEHQKQAFTSLWYLYRLDYSPELNRPLMDSFFKALKEYVMYEQNELKWGDTMRRLSHREAELLKILNENRQFTVQRKDILLKIWGDDSFFNSRNLDVYITKLRDYLKDDPHIQILTVKGVGYNFIVG
jgi:Transcriptional regulatory protein, C terminal